MGSAKIHSIAADVNEIRFGYYLTDNWDDFYNSSFVKSEFNSKNKKLEKNEQVDQDGRAKQQALETQKWLAKNGFDKIIKKWWPKQNSEMITKAVGFEVDLDKNPLDILIKTKSGKFLGLSAKSSRGSGNIPFKNPGLGTIEKDLKIKLKKHYQKGKEKMFRKFPNLPKTDSKRKEYFKKHPSWYEKNIQNAEFTKKVFTGIRNDMYNKLKKKSNEDIWKYVKENWMDGGHLEPSYIIVTGRGTGGKYTASVDSRNELKIDKITIAKILDDKIRVYSKGNRICDMRVKFESTKMATSIKFSGE